MSAKGPGEAHTYDGSNLRIGIVHARWNKPIIDALVSGARSTLLAAGVSPSNIITQSVNGSWELPFAAQGMIAASQVISSATLVSAATDLLGSTTDLSSTAGTDNSAKDTATGPLDAIIAIGVLIKGSTMHFKVIANETASGLMRVQLDTRVPVVLGVLTCYDEEQAYLRAGLRGQEEDKDKSYAERGHNHGEDWGKAAVEMAVKRKGWGEGKFIE